MRDFEIVSVLLVFEIWQNLTVFYVITEVKMPLFCSIL